MAFESLTVPFAPAGGGGTQGYKGSPVLGISFTAPGTEKALASQFIVFGDSGTVTVRVAVQRGNQDAIPPWAQGYGRGSAADACKEG